MTNREWNMAIEWAQANRQEGDWAEHEGRSVEIVSMCGGQFLLTDEDGFRGLADTPLKAVWFLSTGEVLDTV